MEAGLDRSRAITVNMVSEARERIILRRETHIDQLVDKLTETGVRRVMTPIVTGANLDKSVSQDDIQYVIDLGLIRREKSGLEIAKPILSGNYTEGVEFYCSTQFRKSFSTGMVYRPRWSVGPE